MTRQAWILLDRRGNTFDFWGRNMKTFRGKSSQRPLIRSGSEWPLYLGLGPMKAFLAGAERDRPCLASFPKCSLAPEPTTTTSSSLDITNMDKSETKPNNTDCSLKYKVSLNSTFKKEQNLVPSQCMVLSKVIHSHFATFPFEEQQIHYNEEALNHHTWPRYDF